MQINKRVFKITIPEKREASEKALARKFSKKLSREEKTQKRSRESVATRGFSFCMFLVYTAVLTVLYLVTVSIFRALLANSSWKQAEKDKLVRQTAIAAFNTIVFAVPFINQKVAYTVSESIAQGIGARKNKVLSKHNIEKRR